MRYFMIYPNYETLYTRSSFLILSHHETVHELSKKEKLMVSKRFESMTDVVSYIENGLGSEGSFNMANQIYFALKVQDNQIHFGGELSEIPDDLWKYAESKNLI